MSIFILIGFDKYIIKNKKVYRKSYETKDNRYGFQARNEREIKKTKEG